MQIVITQHVCFLKMKLLRIVKVLLKYSDKKIWYCLFQSRCYNSLKSLTFSQNDVSDSFNNLKPESSPSPDLIHPLIIQNCVSFVSVLLVDIFNASMWQVHFPSWKIVFLTSLYKKSDTSNINYRPIGKPNIFVKLLDCAVCYKVHQYWTTCIFSR